jgi:hypothetical protein
MWHALAWLQVSVALAGLVLAVTALGGRWLRTWAWVQAAAVAASTVGLAVYVAGEDDYRRNGMSRWAAYDAELVTVAAVVAGTGVAAVLVAAAARNVRGLGGVASLLSIGAATLTFIAYFANSLN